jgi:hypothetical protein
MASWNVSMKDSILISVSLLLLICSATLAQQLPPLESHKLSDFSATKPNRCEYRIAVLDGITQKTSADHPIIVIARLGDGETRANLNWRRLENVRAYWTEYLLPERRRNPETIILAEGERVNGYGQLQFYVGGNLVEVMKVARNADLFIGECYPPDDSYIRKGVYDPCRVKSQRIFYPCRDKPVRLK